MNASSSPHSAAWPARVSALAGLVLALSLPDPAAAQGNSPLYEYFDAHPIPGSLDADAAWCLREGRHGHEYALDPDQEPIYVVDDVIYYVGDSMVRGAPVEAIWYWGSHPLLHLGSAWCVLDGPHAHYWRPWWGASAWSSVSWVSRDGYWTWAGAYDDGYRRSYARWYVPQRTIQLRYLESPRYAPRFRASSHPGVVYVRGGRTLPVWDARRERTPSSPPRVVVPERRPEPSRDRRSSPSRPSPSRSRR